MKKLFTIIAITLLVGCATAPTVPVMEPVFLPEPDKPSIWGMAEVRCQQLNQTGILWRVR